MGENPNPTGSETMSETTTETDSTATTDTTSTETATTTETETGSGKDWQAEAEKWKAFARKHEDSAKANADKAKRFDEFEESQKSEQQKLADKLAAAEARATELEAANLRATVAADKGVPANLLTGSTEDELKAAADALLAFRGEKPKPDFGGGDRGADVGAKGGQLGEADVKRMSPDDIVAAKAEGRLNDYLGIKS